MLSERQLEVVLAVVYEYIKTNEPVGSRSLSKRYLKGRSAATIRNEMSDLEEEGFFTQPHTSAGRVPTEKAYRVYVDNILQRQRKFSSFGDSYVKGLENQRRDTEDLLFHISRLLSKVTNCMGMTALTPLKEIRLMRVDFIRIDSRHVLAIVILEGGLVHHRTFGVPWDVGQEELDDLARRISLLAAGRPWRAVREDLLSFMQQELERNREYCRSAMREMDDLLLSMSSYRFFTGETRYLLGQPDFKDITKLQAVLSLLEEESSLANLVESVSLQKEEGIQVTIGAEHPELHSRECSLVLAPAEVGGCEALIGLIGPVRMDYENAITTVETLIRVLENRESP
ncbi:MAG TPA: heat-inducible transcriptional repressor HrcA [Synergistaceae bacterium]|nr:heat-inducible transcriptional repressor HrcA [Synergistaceae bacterium]HPJ26946.1 heat-inducible transcriptional repressor HrcA [Synergistaceae bacterium]HPQ37820.1 heat-inducible transcriptional repressor HrcA [Synergistaceae bacterium]